MPTRARRGRVVLLTLDRRSSQPMHLQILTGLRSAIERGRLAPGDAVPSSRALAADLGVARTTVIRALEQLRTEGAIAGRRGSAMRVAAQPPAGIAPGVRRASRARPSPRLSAAARALVETPRAFPIATGAFDRPRAFRPGQPAVDLFPTDVWGRLLARRWRRLPARTLGYGDPRGLEALRAAIARHLGRVRGIHCGADQILVTQGSQHAMDLVCRVLLDRGDRAWMEDPGYPGARLALRAAGADITPVPVDRAGLRVDLARAAAPDARLAIVTPARQMPLGGVLSLDRRLALLEWAEAGDRWIIEDDYDSEFRYAARPVAPLFTLDAASTVLHLGTFTKLLFPALRLGYLVLPARVPALMDACVAARLASDMTSPHLEQAVLADFIDDGHLDRHLRTVRGVYRRRLDTLRDAVETSLGEIAIMEPADAGRAVILWLARGLEESAAVAAAAAAGVDVTPLSAFSIDAANAAPALVLGYGGLRDADIVAGIAALAAALRPLARRRL